MLFSSVPSSSRQEEMNNKVDSESQRLSCGKKKSQEVVMFSSRYKRTL